MTASANATTASARNTISRRLLRRIMPAKGPSDLGQKKKAARDRLDDLERWSGRATLIILAGVVAEIAYEFAVPHTLKERLWTTSANALIVVGLAIEYVCILRAIVASGEAQIESDLRVAEVNRLAGEAIERAAKAELEAEQIRRDFWLAHFVEAPARWSDPGIGRAPWFNQHHVHVGRRLNGVRATIRSNFCRVRVGG